MRRKILLSLFLFFLTFHIYTAYGQFTYEEIAQRSQWEDFLKTAEIIEFKDVGKGVTKPIWLTLKKGDVVQKAVWKNPEGIQNGYLEGWRYEIAAYEMDKLLDLNMIPPTVEKRFRNKKGSLQLAIDLLYDELEIQEKNIQFPEEMRDNRTDRKYIMKNGIKGDQPIRRLPRSFVEKIRALTFEKIKEAVGFYLTKREINAIMARKELLLEEIEEMIKEIGEDKVLY